MSLGENITRLRKDNKMSQGELAEKLGVSRQSVSKWETDASVPELSKLVRLSEVFGVTLDELVSDEESSKPERRPADSPSAVYGKLMVRRGLGTALLIIGVTELILFTMSVGLPIALIISFPAIASGILCYTPCRRPVLWCAWSVYLAADVFIRYGCFINWRMALSPAAYQAGEISTGLIMAFVQLVGMIVMPVITAISYRDKKCDLNKKQSALLPFLWAAFFAAHIVIFAFMGETILRHDINTTAVFAIDWGLAAALTYLLIVTVRSVRKNTK